MTRSSAGPDFYEILNLPFPGSSSNTKPAITKQQLKVAYHKALLKHHPDKALSAGAGAVATTTTTLPSYTHTYPDHSRASSHTNKPITVDEITTAYKTLSDPSLRAEYDRALRLDRDRVAGCEGKGRTVFHTGLEVVDLEDLNCEEGEEMDVWYRDCRCGDEHGFQLSERDLEREVEAGEIVVGCRGCSLYMKVLFAVQDDGDEGKT
ncbi:CSL zinc finger-domain-containing protein [Aspergillus undulatus]|uniref:CSL zinc finger-domain-containing protein n=1 Tax=Aspergillus undulatus TaxID=1810928 RepID=UPI003CCC915A